MKFQKVTPPKLDVWALIKQFNMSQDQAIDYIEKAALAEYWSNELYDVIKRPVADGLGRLPMLHLSIKRKDRQPVHDWRDLQEIKNTLVGPENEGIEIYPSESRLVDTSNQYHLWVFAQESVKLPVGYGDRLVMDTEQAQAVGATQR